MSLAAPAKHDAPTLRESAPVAWQDGPHGRTFVTVAYTVANDGTVGFAVGAYDPTRPLTIDPTLTWSATLSGSGSEEGRGIAVAGDGTLVITGATNSVDFPQHLGVQPIGHHGNFDAFVTKLSADGSQVLWQTFLEGSRSDWGYSLGLDAHARPVLVGMTASANLLTTPNAVQASFGAGECSGVPCFDAFIARLSADGSILQYSSYLGGSKNDWAQRIVLATDGSAVLVGETASPSFPTSPGVWQTTSGETTCAPGSRCTDAFVTRIDPSATTSAQALRWSTRLGGMGGHSAWGVAMDSVGDVLVAGETESANLALANAYDPSFGGLSDAFVAKLSGDGTTLRWGTYLGSTHADVGRDVAVDGAGDVYVTGWTSSLGFPTTPGALQSGLAGANDAFVTRLSADGTQLRWSTLVGGRNDDYSTSFTVAADGTSTLVGSTSSVDLPTVRPLQTSHAGPSDGQDLLVATLNPDGSAAHLVNYLGSSSDDRAWDVATAGSGSVRLTGYTGAASFPGGSPPPGGTSNAFVVALDGLTTPGGEPTVEQRMVSYRYDPLQRLTEATETPGTAYRYSYDVKRLGLDPQAAATASFLRRGLTRSLHFCPACLVDRPAYRLIWRFDRIRGCFEHNCVLISLCRRCSASFSLLDMVTPPGQCARCGYEHHEGARQTLTREERSMTERYVHDLASLLTSVHEPAAYLQETVWEAGRRLAARRQAVGLDDEDIVPFLSDSLRNLRPIEEGTLTSGGLHLATYFDYAYFLGLTIRTLFDPSDHGVLADIRQGRAHLVREMRHMLTRLDTLLQQALHDLHERREPTDDPVLQAINHANETLAARGRPVTVSTICDLVGMPWETVKQYPGGRTHLDTALAEDQMPSRYKWRCYDVMRVVAAVLVLRATRTAVSLTHVAQLLACDARRLTYYPEIRRLLQVATMIKFPDEAFPSASPPGYAGMHCCFSAQQRCWCDRARVAITHEQAWEWVRSFDRRSRGW